jgi:hypothetical protein
MNKKMNFVPVIFSRPLVFWRHNFLDIQNFLLIKLHLKKNKKKEKKEKKRKKKEKKEKKEKKKK